MQREACVVVNGMSLMGVKVTLKKQNKQKNTKKSLLPYSTPPTTTKPCVCHHLWNKFAGGQNAHIWAWSKEKKRKTASVNP